MRRWVLQRELTYLEAVYAVMAMMLSEWPSTIFGRMQDQTTW